VENLRRGMHPKDAGMDAMKRIKANTVEKRLQRADGNPNFNINFYILNARGEHAGVTLYTEKENEHYAFCNENGAQTIPCEPLLPGKSTD
jgi:N4-(beta-N-acetylglucosaminyl)-L-asparaginase